MKNLSAGIGDKLFGGFEGSDFLCAQPEKVFLELSVSGEVDDKLKSVVGQKPFVVGTDLAGTGNRYRDECCNMFAGIEFADLSQVS